MLADECAVIRRDYVVSSIAIDFSDILDFFWILPPLETSLRTGDQSTMTTPRLYQPWQIKRVRNSAANHLLLLLSTVCQRIKDLGIKKFTRGCRSARVRPKLWDHGTGVNHMNLVNIETVKCCKQTWHICMLLSTQSVCSKATTVQEHVLDQAVDLVLLTETWLKGKTV